MYIHFTDDTADGHSECTCPHVSNSKQGGYEHGDYIVGIYLDDEDPSVKIFRQLKEMLNEDVFLDIEDIFAAIFKAGARAQCEGLLTSAAEEAVGAIRLVHEEGRNFLVQTSTTTKGELVHS
jgi:hypothetical protein